MPSHADERSRVLGGLVCLAAIVAGALFLYGVSLQSYWALAIPVALLLLFVLVLITWIGWTIATVQVEAEGESLVGGGGPGSATTPAPEAAEDSSSVSEDT